MLSRLIDTTFSRLRSHSGYLAYMDVILLCLSTWADHKNL